MKLTKVSHKGREHTPWRLFYVDQHGRGISKYFKVRAEANRHYQKQNEDRHIAGNDFAQLDAKSKRLMFAAWERAKAHGYTMDEAHEAIMAKKALSLLQPISVGRAVDEFIDLTDRRLEGGHIRPDSARSMRTRCMLLKRDIGDMQMEDVVPATLKKLIGEHLAPRTQSNIKADWITFFNWALEDEQKYVRKNPAKGINLRESKNAEAKEREPGVLSVAGVEKLMHYLKVHEPEHVAWFALAIFAGIRPREVRRLDWTAIDWEENCVSLSGVHAKGRFRRVIAMENNPTLRAWLEWGRDNGSVLPNVMSNRPFKRTRTNSGIIGEYTDDCMRHTFASCWLAATGDKNLPQGDEDELRAAMGHTEKDTVWRHYKALVSRSDARQFWAIRP